MPAAWVNLLVINLLAGFVCGQQKLLLSVCLCWERKPVSFLHVRCSLYRRSCPLRSCPLLISPKPNHLPRLYSMVSMLGTRASTHGRILIGSTKHFIVPQFTSLYLRGLSGEDNHSIWRCLIMFLGLFSLCVCACVCVREREGGYVCMHACWSQTCYSGAIHSLTFETGTLSGLNPSNRPGCLDSRLLEPCGSDCLCPSMSSQSHVTTHSIFFKCGFWVLNLDLCACKGAVNQLRYLSFPFSLPICFLPASPICPMLGAC